MALRPEYDPRNVQDAIDEKGASFARLTDKAHEVTTPATAGQEFAVAHGLNRVPTRFLIVSADKDARLYWGASASTKTTAYLKCSAAAAKLSIVLF